MARQFLEYLERKGITEMSAVQLQDVSLFFPLLAPQYQPTSMRTVLSALRSFLRFVEEQKLTPFCLSSAIPGSFGRKTAVIPTITREEEQKLLSGDFSTPSGKRNLAMLLLALRTGLRSVDIINLKLADIHWKRNTIEIVQEKTGTPLILPLLTEVGNAIADYILNGRPASPQPYIFPTMSGTVSETIRAVRLLWDQSQDYERNRGPAGRKGPKRISLPASFPGSATTFSRNTSSRHFQHSGPPRQRLHEGLLVHRSAASARLCIRVDRYRSHAGGTAMKAPVAGNFSAYIMA